jgi:ATP-dependent DNA helicase RecG
MKENQTIEWKETWRDEYLKWICGFANAQGGRLVIGKNDQGESTGVKNARKLLKDLPNKSRDLLGIVMEVNLIEDGDKDLLEIRVEPYPNPISYRGKYYVRSGSTLQELKGTALDRFLLRRQGRTWDGVPLPQLSVKDLSDSAIDAFRKLAARSGRLDPTVLKEAVPQLLEKLRLVEGDYLKRAAALLFTTDPEDFITGAFVKIGYFRSESDLAYHDEVRGDLFAQVRHTVDLLRTKYLKAAITYEGIQRIETFPVPEAALREAILNALIHKDYTSNAPVQVRVYADKIKIWNSAELPESWTLEKLLGEHSSRPFNPSVANVFFRAGEIEAWGRGIQRIFEACHLAETPEPLIRYEPNDLWIEFPFAKGYLAVLGKIGLDERLDERLDENLNERRAAIVRLMRENPAITVTQIGKILGISRTGADKNIQILKKNGWVRRVGSSRGGRWEVKGKS